MTDMSLAEGVALSVIVVMALALVSFLANVKMVEGELPDARRRQVLLSIWLLVFGLIAVLLALRLLSGGPVIGGTPSAGGVWLGLHPRQVIALVGAIVLLLLGYARLRAILQPLEIQKPAAPPPALSPESDRET